MTGAAGWLGTFALFALTALLEILGCFLPLLWWQGRVGAWVLLPAVGALAGFVALLALHPAASGRVYAAYGGVYVVTALAWLWAVDGVRPSGRDALGVAFILLGAAYIVSGWRRDGA